MVVLWVVLPFSWAISFCYEEYTKKKKKYYGINLDIIFGINFIWCKLKQLMILYKVKELIMWSTDESERNQEISYPRVGPGMRATFLDTIGYNDIGNF